MNQMNPMMLLQLIGMLKNGGGNPQQLMMNMLQSASANNPMAANVMNMAQNGNFQQIETFARNVCKERGVDFDSEFAKFRQQYGI